MAAIKVPYTPGTGYMEGEFCEWYVRVGQPEELISVKCKVLALHKDGVVLEFPDKVYLDLEKKGFKKPPGRTDGTKS